jgi:hypothetical protein
MTTINWLILFRDIIAFYSENHTKSINTLCGQNAELLNVKAGGKYSYRSALKQWFPKWAVPLPGGGGGIT